MAQQTPFQIAMAHWEQASIAHQRFNAELDQRRAEWLKGCPTPIRYCLVNEIDVKAARDNRKLIPWRLSSDPSDMANPDFPRFTVQEAIRLWQSDDHARIYFDDVLECRFDARSFKFRDDLPAHIQALHDHSALEAETFEADEAREEALWSDSFDARLAVMKTPATSPEELHTRIRLYSWDSVAGPVIGWTQIRASIFDDMARLMGALDMTTAMQHAADNAAQDEARDVQADIEAMEERRRQANGIPLTTKSPVTVTDNSILVQSMGAPSLSFHLSWAGEVIGTYWDIYDGPCLTATDRAAIEQRELDAMASTDWGQSETRLDWLIKLARGSGLSMDSLEQITRPLFQHGDGQSVENRLSRKGIAA